MPSVRGRVVIWNGVKHPTGEEKRDLTRVCDIVTMEIARLSTIVQ